MKERHDDWEGRKNEFLIASKEAIVDCMERLNEPVSFKRLAKVLKIENSRDRQAFKQRLKTMVLDGQLVVDRRNIYAIANRLDLFEGLVSAHPDGFGFVVCDEPHKDIFLSYKQMRALFHGDRVLVRTIGTDKKGREEGEVVDVLERNTSELVGRICVENRILFFEPLHRRISHKILIENFKDPPVGGQIVVGKISQQPSLNGLATVQVIETLGESLTPDLEVEIAIRNHNLPNVFSEDALSESDALPTAIKVVDTWNRVDLRELDLVTIDGEDARDFDDAIYCENRPSGDYRLIVAIADVSAYVSPGSALDVVAHERGTSVYFPQYVVPMLPEKLSNGLCSLRPNVDRLAVVCDMSISSEGRISGYEFYEAVICSKERLTYSEVFKWIEAEKFPRHEASLSGLLRLTSALKAKRDERGALDFNVTEVGFTFDDLGRVENLKLAPRNFAHQIVEECMLCANVCAARLIARSKAPGLFRIHEEPETKKIEQLREFLSSFGIDLGAGGAADYQDAIKTMRSKKNGHILQVALLRSLRQAVYQTENLGHFGLAFSHYAHFTSPIRRYPDLLVHRLIKSLIYGGIDIKGVRSISNYKTSNYYEYSMDDVVALGEHCSFTERRAEGAVHEVLEWIKCDFMSNKVGKDYEGVISAVTKFGFFVILSDVYVDGLVHVKTLLDDHYHFDIKKQQLVGKRRGAKFAPGDTVEVKIARVDVEERKIDLELLAHFPRKEKRDTSDKSSKTKSYKTTMRRTRV